MDLKSINETFVRFQFNAKMRLAAYRKLSRFLGNGIQLGTALDIMWQHASDDGKKKNAAAAVAFDAWRRNIRNGLSFGRAIAGWVPDQDRIVIQSGEEAGNLKIALDNAIFIFEGSKKIKSAIIGGLAYPGFIVLIAIGFMVMFGIQVIPAFEGVLPRERWTGVGAQMAGLSDFVQFYLAYVMAGVFTLIAVVVGSMPRWTGRYRAIADRFPPYSLFRLNAGAGFMLAVAAMIKAGVAIPQIMRILANGSSPWFAERMNKTLLHINNGHNLGEALYRTGLGFPDMDSVKDLRAYASLEGFDETLQKLGEEWMEDSVEKIKAQANVMKNVALLIMGGVFGWIVGGIFSLQQQIQSSL